MMRFCLPLLAIVLCGAKSFAAKDTEVFALVVATNASLDKTVTPLRYADDDGARFYELISTVANRVDLLSVMDAETQKTFPKLAASARRPSAAQLRRTMTELRRAMTRARQRGKRTEFFFYFAGHGHVGADREGYVSLLDGRFSRSDLFREVIQRSTADVNHVIIDACNAYFLVKRRGPERGKRHERAVRAFLAQENLESYPHTGVILSTATAAESHEWSRYRSGIFSHQLLSALLGGADVNNDWVVDYAELRAYIAAANLKVSNPQARLAVYARPPAVNHRTPLIDLRKLRQQAGRVAYLEVPRRLRGHYYIEDDRGVRYLDFNKSAEQPLRLALLARPFYYLRSRDREAVIKLSSAATQPAAARQLSVAALQFVPRPVQHRGSVEESFRKNLYAFPFGRAFAEGYAAHSSNSSALPERMTPTVDPRQADTRAWYQRPRRWKWIALGGAVAAATVGVVMQVQAVRTDDELEAGSHTMREAVDLQNSSRNYQTTAGIAFGVAGAAAVSSIVLFFLDANREPGARAGTQSAGVFPLPGGAALSLGGAF